jgi:hypothetical protein
MIEDLHRSGERYRILQERNQSSERMVVGQNFWLLKPVGSSGSRNARTVAPVEKEWSGRAETQKLC